MYLTENAKKLLDAAIASQPTIQGRFYSAIVLAKAFGIADADESIAGIM